MRRCLLFISLLFLTGLNVFSQEYKLLMQFRDHNFSSIRMMNTSDDGSIMGTVVNEFGIKAFDFTFANDKAQVLNVVVFLDKWYIRKVLRKDLTFILQNLSKGQDVEKGKRRMTFLPNGDIEVVDGKYNIRYTFSPMKGNHETVE